MKTVNIAMLGSGSVAGLYMEGLANVNRQQVVVNYSRSADRALSFARHWGIAEHSTELDDVIARDDIDLFVIALPNEEHEGVSLKLSAAERNQVCARPLGRSRGEARRMFAAARVSGRLHGYADSGVFAPALVTARQAIDRGTTGRVLWVRSRHAHAGPHADHLWDIERAGGGVMSDLGCHAIEAARYFFGKDDDVVEVMAWGERLVHHERTGGEDNALLVMRFASGGVGHCELSWTSKGGLDLRMEVHGVDGSVLTDVARNTPVTSVSGRSGFTRLLPEEAFTLGFQAEMRHFVECVRDGQTPRETYRDGYIVNCVLDAGYESMRERGWVRVEY
jgi:predicted dehydrogenase